jgi:AraC-like DNA-binding protein
MIALAGTGFYGVGNDLIKCRPGNIFFFEAGQQHQNGYPPFAPTGAHLWISLISHHASARILAVRRGKITISGGCKYFKSYPEIGVWPDRCWPAEIPSDRPIFLYRARLLSALSILLTDIIQTGFLQPRDNQHASTIKLTIKAIQNHVWETGGQDASLDNLSRIAGFSKYHFLRLFKKSTGQSVHSFVNMARINKYHELLKARAAKKQMAERLGFSCPAAFSRWLRQNIS